MKFFRKTSVAVLLTALVVVLCCVWGYTRAYTSVQQQEETQSQRAGENNLNYFLRQFQDDARLFDLDTTDTLARSDLELNNTYGTMLALRTANYLNGQDIETYAKDYFAKQKLGRTDMLLVIEVNSRAWYLVYGPGLRSYADGNQALATLVRENLDDAFFDGESNQGILSLFEDLETWCKDNLPEVEPVVQSGIPSLQINDKVQVISLWDVFVNIIFTLLVNIWWIILLLVALNVVDRYRFMKYVERHLPDNGDEPTAPFHPILFWHRQGSAGTAGCWTWSWTWKTRRTRTKRTSPPTPRNRPMPTRLTTPTNPPTPTSPPTSPRTPDLSDKLQNSHSPVWIGPWDSLSAHCLRKTWTRNEICVSSSPSAARRSVPALGVFQK
ncbi:MAG: TPM domain-containing protein [Evtepia sp.]